MLVKLRRLGGAASLALLVMLMSAPVGLAQPSATWQIEPVFTLGDVGENASLAIDSADQLHISYLDATNANLMYAYYNGTSWVTELVDSGVDDSIFGTSIAVDSSNIPHIAYNDGLGNLKYARRFGPNNFNFNFVDEAGDNTGWYPSLALDSQNQPYIAYLAEDTQGHNEDLRFAYFDELASTWVVTTPDGEGNISGPSLALDASGNPHIAYTNSPGGGLYYISGQLVPAGPGMQYSWTTEIIEDSETIGSHISLAISSIGDAHIAYIKDSNLQYARRYSTSGAWTFETVDAQERVGSYNSLAFDSQGWPHISYYDNETSAIKYASFTIATGWQTEFADPLGGPGTFLFDGFTSLAFDSQDHPHIAYHDPGDHDLMHATRESGGPPTNSPPTVEAGGDYSGTEGSPIALDATISDPDNDSFSTAWGYGDPNVAACTFGNPHQADTTFTCTDDGTFTVSLQAYDGNHDPVTDHATVTISNVDPQVDLGDDVEIFLGETFSLDGEFTDPGTDDTHAATVDYGDGTGEQTLTLNTDDTFSLSHTYLDNGQYTVEVCVDDDDGGSGCDTLQVTVSFNDPPNVEAGGDYSGTEGSLISFDATVSDPDNDLLDTIWTYELVSGDPGTQCFGDPSVVDLTIYCTDDGTFTFTLEADDGHNPPVTDSVTLTISNANPQVDLGDDDEIDEGDTFTATGSFSDPGAHDTHTATVDYGDGAGEQDLTLNTDDDTFSLSHPYLEDGQYDVTVCVDDDDAGQGCDVLQVTVNNVVPTVTLGDDVEIDEGETFTATGSFTDPGVNDTHTATVDYGDGSGEQTLTLNSDGTFALSHAYLDNGQYTVYVCVDDGNQGVDCDDVQVTVLNVAPTITNIATTVSNDRVTVTVTATDPAGDNDPFSYSFDCDNDETYDVGPQPENSATCLLGPYEGSFVIGVRVDDGDGGVTVTTVTVSVATNLCASNHTGVLRYSDSCQDHETAITVSDEAQVELCASIYNNTLRLAGPNGCTRYDVQYLLPDDGPLTVCVNRYTQVMRVVDDLGQCAAAELGRVIGATEIGDLPPPRTR